MLAKQLATGIDTLDKALQGPALTHLLGKTGNDHRTGGGIQITLDATVYQYLHMPLGLTDKNQHPRGPRSPLQVLFTKLLPCQPRGAPAAQRTGDQPADQARVAQQQAQTHEQQHVGHQQATYTGPPRQPLQQTRQRQGQHRGPQ